MPRSILASAIDHFRSFGVTAQSYESFSPESLRRIAGNVRAALCKEFSPDNVDALLAEFVYADEIAPIQACGPRAHSRRRLARV
ncbi:MAG: hypothetical protein U0136_10360 [Bdellovibrionota bacterium]